MIIKNHMKTVSKNKYRIKKVQCLVCGKKGVVKIDKKTGKILSNDFWYFGKINIMSMKTSKYFYEVLFDKNDKILRDKSGFTKEKKILNKDYNPKAKPKYIEYWECKKCRKEEPN